MSGILSTNADAMAETHKIIRIATASRDSSEHDKITFSVCRPIQSINPSTASDSIRMNRAAKNNKVDHSTRAKTASMSSRSANISNSSAANNAVQPRDSRWIDGTEWRKKNVIANVSVTADLMSRFLLRMGYWNGRQMLDFAIGGKRQSSNKPSLEAPPV